MRLFTASNSTDDRELARRRLMHEVRDFQIVRLAVDLHLAGACRGLLQRVVLAVDD